LRSTWSRAPKDMHETHQDATSRRRHFGSDDDFLCPSWYILHLNPCLRGSQSYTIRPPTRVSKPSGAEFWSQICMYMHAPRTTQHLSHAITGAVRCKFWVSDSAVDVTSFKTPCMILCLRPPAEQPTELPC